MDNLKELTEICIRVKFPRNYKRIKILKENDKYYEGFMCGMVRDFVRCAVQKRPVYCDSRFGKMDKFDLLYHKAVKLAKDFIPDFKFTSIQFNKNYQIQKHIDGNNTGVSYIIGLGDYEGGELLVYYDGKDKPPTPIDIKNKFFTFPGHEYYHEVAEFTGNRITLVYFDLLPKDISGCVINGVLHTEHKDYYL